MIRCVFFFLEDLKTFKREKYIGEKSWVQGFQKPSSNIIFSIRKKNWIGLQRNTGD